LKLTVHGQEGKRRNVARNGEGTKKKQTLCRETKMKNKIKKGREAEEEGTVRAGNYNFH
jgi:hypothetical protein